jgi:hypothetical protein
MTDKSVPRAVEVIEQVKASEVQIGQRVFFPNSRHAQPVIAITDTAVAGQQIRTLVAEGVRHAVGDDALVRRVRPDA